MDRKTENELAVLSQVCPTEIDELVSAGTLVIDVRDPEDYGKSNVPGAVNISISVLAEKAAAFIPSKDAAVICYCNGGSRGPRAVVELQKLGYANVRSIAGGLRAYVALGNGPQ
jgi:rhodanese-related sulfurtransferase